MSESLRPSGLWPTRLLCPWDSPGKNIGVGCHFLFQGILLAQGLKLYLLSPALQADSLPAEPLLLLSNSEIQLANELWTPYSKSREYFWTKFLNPTFPVQLEFFFNPKFFRLFFKLKYSWFTMCVSFWYTTKWYIYIYIYIYISQNILYMCYICTYIYMPFHIL